MAMANEIVTASHLLPAGTEVVFGRLTAPYEEIEYIVNGNADPRSANTEWRIYEITATGSALISKQVLGPPYNRAQRLGSQVKAGAICELRGFNPGTLGTTIATTASIVGSNPSQGIGSTGATGAGPTGPTGGTGATGPAASTEYAAALAATNWYISWLTGNDANAGTTSGAPLKTFAALAAKWGTRPPPFTAQTVTINIIDHNIADAIDYSFLTTSIGRRVIFQPFATAVLQSGTLTAVRSKAVATNVPLGLTDSAISGGVWPIGKRIKFTSGPALGAYAWTLKDEGAQLARVTNPTIDAFTVIPPVSGNTYNIETLTPIFISNLGATGSYLFLAPDIESGIFIRDLDIRGGTSGQPSFQACTNIQIERCLFGTSPNVTACANVAFNNSFYGAAGGTTFLKSSRVIWQQGGGVGSGTNGIVADDGSTIISNGYIGQNRPMILCNGSSGYGTEYAAFDCLVTSYNSVGDGLLIGGGTSSFLPGKTPCAWSNTGALWGAGNAGAGVAIDNDCDLVYSAAGQLPTITGTGGSWRSCTNGSTQQSFGYNGATLAAEGPFANTWALLNTASPTGFGGCAFDPRTGARVAMKTRVFT